MIDLEQQEAEASLGEMFATETAQVSNRNLWVRTRAVDDHVLAGILAGAAFAFALLGIGAAVLPPAPEAPVQVQAAPTPPAQPVAAVAPAPAPPPTAAVDAFRPTRVNIGSIGITADVEPVGTQPDGQMEIPPDPMVVGWWEGSMLAGEAEGNTVLAGHVFNTGYGPGVFAELQSVSVGDNVDVVSGDGLMKTYRVTSVERVSKLDFPADVIFARTGAHQLVLATCADYDPDTRHYEDNLFVYASPV